MATLGEKTIGNPAANPGADANALEAQPVRERDANCDDYRDEGYRSSFYFIAQLFLLVTMLAFIIAAMVGIFQIKKDVNEYLEPTPLVVLGARAENNIMAVTNSGGDCVPGSMTTGGTTLANATLTSRTTVTFSTTVTATVATVTVQATTSASSGITTTETAVPVQGTLGETRTVTIFLSAVSTTTITPSATSSTTSLTTLSTTPAVVNTSEVSGAQGSVPAPSTLTTTVIVPATNTLTTTVIVPYGSGMPTFFSANSTGSHANPSAPSGSTLASGLAVTASGMGGAVTSFPVTSGASATHTHKSGGHSGGNGVLGGNCVVVLAMVVGTVVYVIL